MRNDRQFREQEEIEATKFDLRVKNDFESDSLLIVKEKAWTKIKEAKRPYGAYVASIKKLGNLQDKCLLEMGCGSGWLSVIFSKLGAKVEGIDVSKTSIEVARKRAIINLVEDQVNFHAMSAHNLAYEDESFELVYGLSILHHVNVEKAIGEVKRVLKKGGKAVFLEPVINLKIVEAVRKLIPIGYDDDAEFPALPLSAEDVRIIMSKFEKKRISYHRFFFSLERAFRNERVLRMLEILDASILQFKLLEKLGRQATFELYN